MVDYHFICAVYFSDDVPSGEDLAKLWSGLGVLGDWPVELSFVCRGDTEVSLRQKSTLGTALLGDIFVSKADKIISAGASSFRKNAHNAILDSDVNFIFSRDNTWNGYPLPASLSLSVSDQLIQQIGSGTLLSMLRRFFDITDVYAPIQDW